MPSRTELELPTRPVHHSYKYKWARQVVRENLVDDFHILNKKLKDNPDLHSANSLTQLVSEILPIEELTGSRPEPQGQFKVGIVGAGCSGLFTAMILDHINEKIPDLNITYDVLEANGTERHGGRLYTHHFSPEEKDYYDIGAMRFPKIPIMDRTFRLFEKLGIDKKLIPYHFKDTNGVCPTYYNDRHTFGPPPEGDAYAMNEGLPANNRIPDHLMQQGSNRVMDEILHDYKEQVQNHLQKPERDGTKSENGNAKAKDWIPLKKADYMSTRQYLRSKKDLNFNTIEWLETFDTGTGWYDQSLTETVLESLDFDENADWFCINGGSQQVATEMVKQMRQKPEFHRQVTAITASPGGKRSLKIKHKDSSKTETRDYFAIFNSTTLGALQRMDLTEAGLRYGTKQAIRSLGYGASCKVAIKFKTPWWQQAPFNIKKGGMGKTDLPIRVCVYPSYNLDTPKDHSAVLLCSYTWAQDADRMGSLISRSSPSSEDELREVLIHNLTLLHASDSSKYAAVRSTIEGAYETHHAYDWNQDPHTAGAFAYFGPGQFSKMWPEIIRPNGWLYLVGEAASAHHAWVVGSLESSVRAVFQMLQSLHWQDEGYAPYGDAMRLLATADGSPFSPLPLEMPLRQEDDAARDGKPADVPTKGRPLTFTSAQVALSFCESFVQKSEEEAK